MVRSLALLVATLTLPMHATAQPTPMPPPAGGSYGMPPISAETQAKFTELQTIGDRLKDVRQKASKSAKLAKAMDSFRADVEAQMIKDSPVLEPKVKRFRAVEKQLDPLIAANDFEKAQPLLMEMRTLAGELSDAQQKALEAKGLAERGKTLQDNLRTEMRRIEPKLPQLLARADALQKELQQAVMMEAPGGASGGPRRPGPQR